MRGEVHLHLLCGCAHTCTSYCADDLMSDAHARCVCVCVWSSCMWARAKKVRHICSEETTSRRAFGINNVLHLCGDAR